MQEQVTDKLLRVAQDCDNITQAVHEVLIADENTDVPLTDGTTTPSLSKRVKQFGSQVTKVVDKVGEVSAEDIANALELGTAAKQNASDLMQTSNLKDESGLTQQKINSGIEGLLDLKATLPLKGSPNINVYLGSNFISKYVWDANSSAVDDGLFVIKPTDTVIGRWLLSNPYDVNTYQAGVDLSAQDNEKKINLIKNLADKKFTIIGNIGVSDTVLLNQSYSKVTGNSTRDQFTYYGEGGSSNTLNDRKPIIKMFNDNQAAISQSNIENITVQMNYKDFCTGIDARYLTAQSKIKDIIIRGVADNSVGLLLSKIWYSKFENIFISGYNPSLSGRHGTGVIIDSIREGAAQVNAIDVGVSCHTLNVGYHIKPNNYIYGLNLLSMPTIENCDIGIKVDSSDPSLDFQVRQSVISAYFENNGIDIQWGTPITTRGKTSKHTWLGCSFDDVHSRVELYEGHHIFIGCKGIVNLHVGEFAQCEFINTPRPLNVTGTTSNAIFISDPLTQVSGGNYQSSRTKPQSLAKYKSVMPSGTTSASFDISGGLNSSIPAEGQTIEFRAISRRGYDTVPSVITGIILRKASSSSIVVTNSPPSTLTASITGSTVTISDTRGDAKTVDLSIIPD